MSQANDIKIELDQDNSRFIGSVDGHDCVLDFRLAADRVAMTSVRVPEAAGGRGIAGQLTRHALDWARARGLKVDPVCPYVKTWIQRHPDYQDLLLSGS